MKQFVKMDKSFFSVMKKEIAKKFVCCTIRGMFMKYMQILNKTQITFHCEQMSHNAVFLDKRGINKYSGHYTVNSKSRKSSVKNRYITSRVFFVVIEPYIFYISAEETNYQ